MLYYVSTTGGFMPCLAEGTSKETLCPHSLPDHQCSIDSMGQMPPLESLSITS